MRTIDWCGVIINLINNASKYTPDANEVRISTERNNCNIILRGRITALELRRKTSDNLESFYRVSGNKGRSFPGRGPG